MRLGRGSLREIRAWGVPACTSRASDEGEAARPIDLCYLARWAGSGKKPALRKLGVDGIFLGKKQKFITVASNLTTGEQLWFGQERKKKAVDGLSKST